MPEEPESDLELRKLRWRSELSSARRERIEVRKIASQAQLWKDDVLRVVRGLRTDGLGACEVSDSGIRALYPTSAEERALVGNEVNAIGDYARSIKLDLPCTQAALLDWAKRNGYRLASVFEVAARKRLGKKPAHRPRKLDPIIAEAKSAAAAIFKQHSDAKRWSAWEVITHREFVESVFPDKARLSLSVLDERKYTKHYGVSPRELKKAVLEVLRSARSAEK